jgi:transposase
MTTSEFQTALDQAKIAIAIQAQELRNKEAENKLLREKIRLLQFRQFGKSSERLGTDEQDVFPEIATTIADDPEKSAPETLETIEVKAHKKAKGGRKRLPAELPRREVLVDLPEHEKSCKTHGVALKRIGEERSEALEHIPESFTVLVTVRPKYGACPCCEETEIKIAPVPFKLIPKSICTPSLLTHITLSKFVDHLPLYRQETIYARAGVALSRGTMAEWVWRLGEAVIPIINLLEESLLEGEYLSCDETPIRVLTDDGKRVKNLHYLWIRGRPPDFGKPIYLFEYAPSRRTEVAKRILDGFKGILQADQYIAYSFAEKHPEIVRTGCLAHIRRKFFEAQKAMKEKQGISGRALALIKKLYRIQEQSAEIEAAKRTQWRKDASDLVLAELKSFLEENRKKVPPQSATGKAISYALNSWQSIELIYSDHRIPLDNNLTENAIRPVAVGRKNYLFCHSDEGAAAAARIYSLIATAKANGLELREYFMRLISELPKATTLADYEALLPLA